MIYSPFSYFEGLLLRDLGVEVMGGGPGQMGSQQQPPEAGFTGVLSIFMVFSEPPAVAPGPILFLISAAMVMKACSTFVAFLALVSKKGMPRESANSFKKRKKRRKDQTKAVLFLEQWKE